MQKTIIITSSNKAVLNPIADFIIDEKESLIEQLDKIEFVEGAASLFASGDNPIVKIIIEYSDLSDSELADIKQIIALAEGMNGKQGADKIDVQINETAK